MAYRRAARQRRVLEKEARRLLKQWVRDRKQHENPPDNMIRFSAICKRKAWFAPFKTGADEALILSNGTIALKGGIGNSWLAWKQRTVYVIMYPYSDSLSEYDLQVIIAGLRADLAP